LLHISGPSRAKQGKLNARELGRLGRLISHRDLIPAALTVLGNEEMDDLVADNKYMLDLKFAILMKWEVRVGISIAKLHCAYQDAGIPFDVEYFEQVNSSISTFRIPVLLFMTFKSYQTL